MSILGKHYNCDESSYVIPIQRSLTSSAIIADAETQPPTTTTTTATKAAPTVNPNPNPEPVVSDVNDDIDEHQPVAVDDIANAITQPPPPSLTESQQQQSSQSSQQRHSRQRR